MSQILFFSSSWLNTASMRPTRNAYFIHKTMLVRDKLAQIHTNNAVQSYFDIVHCVKLYASAWLCNGVIRCTFSSHRLVHNQLTRCCTISSILFTQPWQRLKTGGAPPGPRNDGRNLQCQGGGWWDCGDDAGQGHGTPALQGHGDQETDRWVSKLQIGNVCLEKQKIHIYYLVRLERMYF